MSLQFTIVSVRQEDFIESQDETMGTKSKFWFEHPELGRCLYKHIRPDTGEDWAEKVAEQLCKLLGLPHANYELAETWEGKYGIVSRNFLFEDETLIHGNEILTPLVPDYPTNQKKHKASQHTINIVLKAIESSRVQLPPDWNAPQGISTAKDLFIGYILLDTLIGNGDRHHENWGFVSKQANPPNLLYLSPTYDHASCLGRELLDTKRQKLSVEVYANRCTSAFYRDANNKKRFKTFELFHELSTLYPATAQVWLNRLASISQKNINLIFQAIPQNRISPIAAKFAQDILIFNFNRLLSL